MKGKAFQISGKRRVEDQKGVQNEDFGHLRRGPNAPSNLQEGRQRKKIDGRGVQLTNIRKLTGKEKAEEDELTGGLLTSETTI
ncbi:hypothetical protein Trydic_g3922 [Trypoxylus dichotomus]